MVSQIAIRDRQNAPFLVRAYTPEGYRRGIAALTRVGVFHYDGDDVRDSEGYRVFPMPPEGQADTMRIHTMRIHMSRASVLDPTATT